MKSLINKLTVENQVMRFKKNHYKKWTDLYNFVLQVAFTEILLRFLFSKVKVLTLTTKSVSKFLF